MTGIPSAWVQPGVVIGVLGVAGGFLVWAWRAAILPFFDLFGHGKRLKALEDGSATKAAVTEMGDELRKLHKDHVAADALAFATVNEEIGRVREGMARREDLARVESNLTDILMDGFKKAGRRT